MTLERRALKLIDQLYRAGFDLSAWPPFIRALSDELGGAAIALTTEADDWMNPQESYWVGLDVGSVESYRRHVERGLPWGSFADPVFRQGFCRTCTFLLTINDPGATLRVAVQARRIAPNLTILARATFLQEVSRLRESGVDEVVPQELETAAEILVRSLRHFLVPDDEVGRQVARLRKSLGIDKLAPKADAEAPRLQDFVPGLDVMIFKVEADSPVADRPLSEVNLRGDVGINVVAYQRGDHTSVEIGPDTVLEPGDVVVALGREGRDEEAAVMFRGSTLSEAKPVLEGQGEAEDAPLERN